MMAEQSALLFTRPSTYNSENEVLGIRGVIMVQKGSCISFGSGCCNNIQAMPASDPFLFVTIFSVRRNAPYTSMVHDHFPWDFGGVPPAVIVLKDSTLDHCL